jgi:glutathione reductase (NADPH)
LLETPGARIVEGRARLIDSHTVEVAGERFTAEYILLATGGHPIKSAIPGQELSITSDEIFHLERLPKRIVIAGGGYVAVEFAGIFNGLGSEVTLVHRGSLFMRGFDDDVRTTLAEEMSKRGIDLRFETTIESIHKRGSALAATTNHGETLEADHVLSAIGRAPNTAGLGLEETGVELDERGAVVVGEYLESTVPNIFAVGDCVDRIALTPVAITEGMAFAETQFNDNPTRVDYANVPTAVFSQPSVGAVGLTEAEARAQGREVVVYRSSFRPISNALAGRDERTMVKLVVDRVSDRVLGAHMVGADAGEIIQGLAVALKAGATKATFDATIAIHPTVAEEFVTMRKPAQV